MISQPHSCLMVRKSYDIVIGLEVLTLLQHSDHSSRQCTHRICDSSFTVLYCHKYTFPLTHSEQYPRQAFIRCNLLLTSSVWWVKSIVSQPRFKLMVAYQQASWLLKISLDALDYLPWRYSCESIELKIFSQQPESHHWRSH